MDGRSPPETIRLTFTLTRDEFMAGKRRLFLRSPYIWTLVSGTIAAAAVASFHWKIGGGTYWLPVVVCGWWGFFLTQGPGLAYSSSKVTPHERSFVIDDNGLTEDWGSGNSRLTWHQFRGAVEFTDMYVLLHRANAAVFPRRVFDPPAAESQFRELVGKHVKLHTSMG